MVPLKLIQRLAALNNNTKAALSKRISSAAAKLGRYNFPAPENRLTNTLVGGSGGGAIGGAIGAIRGKKGSNKDRLKQGLKGAGIGATSGGLAGLLGPLLAQRGFGRVITNLVEPFSYNAEKASRLVPKELDKISPYMGLHSNKAEWLRKHPDRFKLKDMIKAIIKDKPIYLSKFKDSGLVMPTTVDAAGYTPREVPYRRMYGLKPRAFKDTFHEVGNKLIYRKGGTGYKDEMSAIEMALQGLPEAAKKGKGRMTLNTASAGANISINPETGAFSDRWDFAVDGQENPFKTPMKAMRALAEMLADPRTLEGKVRPRSKIPFKSSVAANKRAFNLVMPSSSNLGDAIKNLQNKKISQPNVPEIIIARR